ncbi:GIY-YIG nuclease family protein [Egbenema bharatensis]|uniref:GIY-YIG nuclease family protein n=1 Tax=Egbenema bharatensis TaxID=3463334 RepID=UPI003A853EB7
MTRIEQTSLFSASELSATYSVKPRAESLQMSREALQTWKQRIFEFQQQVQVNSLTQQGTLFDLSTSSDQTAQTNPDCINPFTLPQQNTEFWRSKFSDTGTAALYFVIDHELPILLYVGETVKSNQRWKGEHDCKRYLLNYVAAHRQHQLSVTVNIGFWAEAPAKLGRVSD